MPAIFDSKYFNAEVFGKYVETIPKLNFFNLEDLSLSGIHSRFIKYHYQSQRFDQQSYPIPVARGDTPGWDVEAM